MEKTSAELSNEIVEIEKTLREQIKNLSLITDEANVTAREILELRVKKKNLEIAQDKAKFIIKDLNLRKSILEKAFWSARNSGA